MNNYTEEQKADITIRTDAALAYLKENGLEVAAVMTKVKIGEQAGENGSTQYVFADQVIPFLSDTKFAPKDETAQPEAETTTENTENA